MAGDWIPMRCDLADDPAVIAISTATGLDAYGVVGRLHRIWSWANQHTTNGNAVSVTEKWVDRYTDCDGFCAAMISAHWLTTTETGFRFPKFDTWNSQSGKKRALTNRRVATHRLKKCNAPSVTKTLPENSISSSSSEKAKPSLTPKAKISLSGLIPEELKTEEFLRAWDLWGTHRKQKGSTLTESTARMQLTKFQKVGVAKSIAMIEYTVEKGWVGLREPEEGFHSQRNGNLNFGGLTDFLAERGND